MSQHEVARFPGAVDNLKHRVILTVCYATGLRISEAVRRKPAAFRRYLTPAWKAEWGGLCASLKAYQFKPIKCRSVALRPPVAIPPASLAKSSLPPRFNRIFLRRTGFVTLDRLLARLHANKDQLLMVLDRPVDPLRGSTPLHTNGWENDIRSYVTRRKLVPGRAAISAATAVTLF